MSEKSQQKVARVFYVVILASLFVILVSPFAVAIALSSSVALALFPLIRWLEGKGMRRKPAAALVTVLFAILISIPFTFFVAKGTVTVTQHLEKINFNDQLREQGVQGVVSDLRHDLVSFVHRGAQKVNISEFLTRKKIDSYLNMVTTFLLKFFKSVFTGLPVIFLMLMITVLCLYSFLKHAENLRRFFQKLFGFSGETMDELIGVAINDARAVYVSNLVTGTVQSLFVATAGALLHMADFFLIFFVTLVLSFVPVIGAAPVAFALGLLAFFQGNTTAAIIMAVVGGVAGTIDNILRPWLASIGGESRTPPITAFVCVLGGALWLGFPGLFLGLLVGTFAHDTIPIFWKEIGKDRHFF